jgi:hypothetical protein
MKQIKNKKIRSKTENVGVGFGRLRGGSGAGFSRSMGFATLLAAALAPSASWACACGCGIFDVGTSSMFPTGPGGMAFLQYDYQDQNQNWSGTSRAPAANNADKAIQTSFVTAGLQYMFNSDWGLMVEVPYVNRTFTTTGGASGNDQVTLNWGDLGDIRVKGIYTGFSPDLSTGVTFGFKLPSGNYTYNDIYGDVDRDSETGTGSTDVLLGGFSRQSLGSDFYWFGEAQLDLPVMFRDEYRPGLELDAGTGVYYRGFSVGGVKIEPLAQVLGSYRMSDSGANASGGANSDPADGPDSGYERVLLSPGIEFDKHPWSLYADAEFPVYQNMTGNQLVAPVLFKVSLSFMF